MARAQTPGNAKLTGELKKWHTVTLTFDGPQCSETDEFNPFLNYRLNVTFAHRKTGKSYKVPGYFAADGNAGMTSATSGNKWRVHFSPDEVGEWEYSVDFKKGKWVAIRSRTRNVPSGEHMDGATGKFSIAASDKTGRDFRAHGRLQYSGDRYLRFADTGEIFFKCGSDAPENFLSYYGFDGDFAKDGHKDNLVKTWGPHLKDWKKGDPQWSNGRGKEIIGALNYLSSKGVNAFSFLTNNIEGDDQNVFPYVDYDTWDRFDCSKLDQWEVVFDHAQQKGLFLHFKTMEHENEGLLDFGGMGGNTRLYYRELIARFGHHLALNWNLCEEWGDWGGFDGVKTMTMSVADRRAQAQFVHDVDPYHHHLVIHNGEDFDPLYGEDFKLTGASLQTTEEDFRKVNRLTKEVIERSEAAGKPWPVACDEPGDPSHALITDAEDPDHFNARTNGLWGNVLAGGWGTEWYFGYKHPHSDLTCQDYRSRDLFWDMGVICTDFFAENDFPVTEMRSQNQLISSEGDFCFAKEGDTYIVLLKKGGESQLDLKESEGDFSVRWFSPRQGGALQSGSVKAIRGAGKHSLGTPPNSPKKDWIAVVRRIRNLIVDGKAVDRINSTLDSFVESGAISGVSALVTEKNKEVYFKAFGMADEEAGLPMARDTIVQIYSMTKPITGVALMTLHEQGKFRLDDPVAKYIPSFANLKVAAGKDASGELILEDPIRPMTIRDLTRHTSGLAGNHGPEWVKELLEPNPLDRENTLAEAAEKISQLPLWFHPGQQWSYGPSVDMQAYLVEVLSGMKFDEYLRTHVLGPLKTNDTRYVVPVEDRHRMAGIYWRDDETGELSRKEDEKEFNTKSWPLTPGGWGLTSTIDDYMRFARMLQNEGELDGVRILKPETVRLMATSQLSDDIKERSWLPSKGQVGFGIDFAVRVRPPASAEENNGAVGEFFWDGAASTMFWVDPKNDLSAVLFVQLRPFDKIGLHKSFRDAVYGPIQ